LAELSRGQLVPSILIRPIERGDNGLTLVEASHVLLCEPLLDAEGGAAAANRVDRIGQARGTALHRFLVRGGVVRAGAGPERGAARADGAGGGGAGALFGATRARRLQRCEYKASSFTHVSLVTAPTYPAGGGCYK